MHTLHTLHALWFTLPANVPASHAVHSRSLVDVPAADAWLPAEQVRHASHEEEFAVVE